MKILYDIIETIVASMDPKVAFPVAAVFGYFLYKLVTLLSRSDTQFPKNSDQMNNVVFTDKYDNYKLVLVIRTDLKMGKGKVAAQCSHAAVAAYKTVTKYPNILRAWEESGQAKITLKVDSEPALMEIAKHARSVGLLSNVVRDAGHTQIPTGSKTVCGIGPGPSKLIDQVTGHLKLF